MLKGAYDPLMHAHLPENQERPEGVVSLSDAAAIGLK